MNTSLSHLKILELAGVLAGPSAGLFFAELGAAVIKIENPKTQGDVTRSWKLPTEPLEQQDSAYYWSVNAGKEVMYLDLTLAEDLQQFYALVKDADIVISNYKLGDDHKLKVDATTLRAMNPRLIYASINGFGTNSPRTAYDLILQAESGFMYMNGTPESGPVKMPVALIDLLAGHQLKEAILLALIHRYETGKGSSVSVSLFDAAVASLANQATNWLIAGHLPKAQGSLHPNIAPYGELFRTKDEHLITFAIGSNKQFRQLCSLLELSALAEDARYSDNRQRVMHRESLFIVLDQAIRHCSFDRIYDGCMKLDIPIGKIRNLKEVFELPEAKRMLHTFQHLQETKTSVRSIAFKISE